MRKSWDRLQRSEIEHLSLFADKVRELFGRIRRYCKIFISSTENKFSSYMMFSVEDNLYYLFDILRSTGKLSC